MSRVGNASTKYCLEPELIDSDVRNKREVAKQFESDLKSILNKEYPYSDGKMSERAKREILIKVHKEFIGG